MAGTAGQGTVTFGSLTAKFQAEDGFSIDGKTLPIIECTPDDATEDEYTGGNVANFGTLSGQMQVMGTSFTELKSLVGTSGTLLWTLPLEVPTNGTPATMTGTAFFETAPLSAPKNGLIKGAAVFRWSGDVTYTNETA